MTVGNIWTSGPEFQAVSNKTYTVQYANEISTGPWSKLDDLVARATNRVEMIHDYASTPQRYYRLVTPRQE